MYLDIFILIVLLWAVISGWRNGFLKELVSTGGMLLGLILAGVVYGWLQDELAVKGTQTNIVLNVVAFLILWIILPLVLGFIATGLTKALKAVHLSLPNSLLGAVVSVVKFTLLLSCIFYMMSALRILNDEKTADSKLYEPVKGTLTFAMKHVAGYAEDKISDYRERKAAERDTTIWVDVSKKDKAED